MRNETKTSGNLFVNGDALPNAPELAARGDFTVGVRTITLVKPGSVDVLSHDENGQNRLYDREISIEVWYPAEKPDGSDALTYYTDYLRQGADPVSLHPYEFAGRAVRGAEPDHTQAPYPLVIVSHGYPGSRVAMSYLTENLASKGYIVAAIGHTLSTYADMADFKHTLLNRSPDQRFVIDQMEQHNAADGVVNGLIDTSKMAVIGFSMGGYGTLATIGAGYNATLSKIIGVAADPLLFSSTYHGDERVKAAVLMAPWGGSFHANGSPEISFWDAPALANITIPTFWIAGSLDDISGYASIVRLFDQAVHSRRYMLPTRMHCTTSG